MRILVPNFFTLPKVRYSSLKILAQAVLMMIVTPESIAYLDSGGFSARTKHYLENCIEIIMLYQACPNVIRTKSADWLLCRVLGWDLGVKTLY